MKNFEYAAPQTESEILELLSPDAGKVEILAGGTDLVGLMQNMVVTPDRVVNIMEVPSMKSIESLPDGGVAIGATVTLDDILVHPYLDVYPAIKQAIRGINSMQIQAQGTLGGEVCQRPQCWFYRNGQGLLGGHAESGDNRYHAILGNSGAAKFVNNSRIAPALICLEAKLRIIGPEPGQEQLLDCGDFFRIPQRAGQRENVLLPNQLVTHVVLPPIAGRTCASYEVRQGAGPDYPLAAAAAALQLDTFGVVKGVRVVLGHVAPTPWLVDQAPGLMVGRRVTAKIAELVGRAAVAAATPLSENGYKVQLATVAVKRALLLAAGLETGGF
jgi:xanthine dehydrogenase YagS FAD-binding subunit